MRFRKIHLRGVHHGPLKMYLLLLMCMHSSAEAEWRGWRESGSFSPHLPALRGGSGSAKDWKSEECPGDGVWNSEISGTLGGWLPTGLPTGLNGPLSLQLSPHSWGPLVTHAISEQGREEETAITVGRGSPGSEFWEILRLPAVGT